MPSSPDNKLPSTFDALARSSWRRLNRRPRAPYFVIALIALMAAGLFIAILVEDRQMQRDSMHRDIDSAALQLGARLSTLSETLSSVAREIGNGSLTETRFAAITQDMVNAKPELDRIEYVDATGLPLWIVVPTTSPKPPASIAPATDAESAINPAIKALLAHIELGYEPAYLPLPAGPRGTLPALALAIPVYIEHRFSGAVIAQIDPLDLIVKGVPEETLNRYRLTLVQGERTLASTSSSGPPSDALTYAARVSPLPREYRLLASAFRLQSRFTTSALVWVVAALTVAVLVALSALARFTKRQQHIDRALLAETTLRRAMEDSVATGLAVIDPQGVIRYVNRTFCRMTGCAESDLVACAPPYPFWPPENRGDSEEWLREMLAGRARPGGFEMAVRRKDGMYLLASAHVSPLMDEAGRHMGWMCAMADVTESARARNELAAAHERFTTVLESLEAAVSVAVVQADGTSEVVFANRAYRSLFGDGPDGHQRLAAKLKGRDGTEVHDSASGRWFDVRTRAIRWPVKGYDGGLEARLQIATDISLRKVTEDLARQQQEKVQFTSRLMTMGEMASSLAHELNQPLTAIANYCEGTLTRLKERQISLDELQNALEKTSAQAHRAGGIIRRIHEFVKRSEPRRRPTPPLRIVEDAIGFAEIEANKKGIHIAASIDPTLEPLLADPLLIEQVLLNLLKNALDAMEDATVRRIDVVVRRSLADGMAEFAVIDRGSGIPEENLPMLFDPFFSTKAEGMGMGLNICRSIVEFHHGRLTVEKNPEHAGGTIMRFTLPIAGETVSETAAAQPTET